MNIGRGSGNVSQGNRQMRTPEIFMQGVLNILI